MRNVDEHTIVDFQRVFEYCPDLYLLLSTDLDILAASDAYLKATFTRRDEITGRKLFDVFPDNPDDPAADGVSNLSASLQYVLARKEAHAMPVQKYDVRRLDGIFEQRYWSPVNTPILDDNGSVLYILHSVEDVTKQQKSAAHLQESEEKFHKVFNASAAGITITRMSDGKYVEVNDTFVAMTGFSRSELINRDSADIGLIMGVDKRAELYGQLRATGSVRDFEMTVHNKSGGVFEVLASIDAIMLDGEQYAIKVIYDISKRKRAERELRELNAELEAFSYSVSHDLRAPLRAVSGFARILEEDYSGSLDSEGKRLLGTISSNAERMGGLIDDLLSFSRLGRKELHKKETKLNDLVAAALQDINRTNGNSSKAKIEIVALPDVVVDPVLMRHVFINLISNALKYSSKKETPEISIGCEQRDSEVVVSVRDNGAGFDMRYANKLFGVFQRLHSVDEFEGTGVGLAIVQRIVHKHGGRVWAEGKTGEGAVFYFSIPKN